MTERRFYVYAYLRESDEDGYPAGSPYYIGKGTARRAWVTHNRPPCAPRPNNHQYIRIIKSELTSTEAFLYEQELILQYGRLKDGTGLLRNFSVGGNGPHHKPEEFRESVSARMRRVWNDPESRSSLIESIRASKRSNPYHWSEETRLTYIKSRTGKPLRPKSFSTKQSLSDQFTAMYRKSDDEIMSLIKRHGYRYHSNGGVGPSGYRGIIWNKNNDKWLIRLSFGGKRVHIDSFRKLEDAITRMQQIDKLIRQFCGGCGASLVII